MQLIRPVIAALFGTLAFHDQAIAVCQLPAPKLCQVLFDNDIAVRGRVRTVTRFSDLDDPEGVAGWRYEVDVSSVYRGATGARIAIESENTTSSLLLKEGREYIIFAASTSELGVFTAWNNCGPIQDVDGQPYSDAVVRSIRKVLTSSVSSIEGEVRDKNWNVVKSVPVTVSAEGMTKTVRTDIAGRFRVTVQPGKYSVHFPDEYRETSYSYYDVPEKPVSLVAGQCAQIQLQHR